MPTPFGNWLTPPGLSNLTALGGTGSSTMNVSRNVNVGDDPLLVDKAKIAAEAPAAVSASPPAPAPGATGTATPGNIGAPSPTYLAAVTGSEVGTEMGDLAAFGLTGPDAQAAVNWYNQQTNALTPPAQMQINMYQQPWFQRAFPGIVQQIKNGQSPMSVQDYVTFKQSVKSFAAQYGIPQGFISDADIGDMIGKGWTFADDVAPRLQLAFQASSGAASKNPEAVALLDKWYGIKPGSGALAAFYLDPNKAVTTLANATTAAQIGASGETAGFTKLDQNTLMSLAAHGVSAAQGQQAVSAATPLLGATRQGVGPGNMPTATEADLIAAQTGGVPGETQAQAIQRVQLAAGGKTAALHGGGGSAGQGQPGPTGAGFGTQ